MTEESPFGLYETARAAVDGRFSKIFGGIMPHSMRRLFSYHLELPSIMASMIAGKDIETDALVLEHNKEYLVDVGFVQTFNNEALKIDLHMTNDRVRLAEAVRSACRLAVSHSSSGLPQSMDEELKRKLTDIRMKLDWRDIFGRENPDITKTFDIHPRERALLAQHMPVYMAWRKRFLEAEPKTYVISYSEDFVLPSGRLLEASPVTEPTPRE